MDAENIVDADALNLAESLRSKLLVEMNSRILGSSYHTDDNGAYIDHGDTAWIMRAATLVLFMTMPGLAIYFAGMVDSKNLLRIVLQIFTTCSFVTFLWLCFGYSLAFTPTGYHPNSNYVKNSCSIYGNTSRFWLRGMTLNSININQAPTIPESVYVMFQLCFAIITCVLTCGSFSDRMRYFPTVVFMGLWLLLVYCPLAHSMWHVDGFMYNYGVLDFAGGNVVHISSGIAGLVASLMLGNRKGWRPKEYNSLPPNNILLTFMGLAMLWIGWFGFNGGSALRANGRACYAVLATQIATCISAMSWMFTDLCFRSGAYPSVLSMVNGAVAGLVAITPASGYVDMNGAFFVGLFAGIGCYFGTRLKHWLFEVDDALDAFGLHAIGGIVGGIATGFFATSQVTGNSNESGVFYSNTWIGGHQLAKQLVGITYSIAWSGIVTFVLLKSISCVTPLRAEDSEDDENLNATTHNPDTKSGAKTITLPTGEVVTVDPNTGEFVLPNGRIMRMFINEDDEPIL